MGQYIASASYGGTFDVYPWSSGFGARLGNPASPPTPNPNSVAFNGNTSLIAGLQSNTPFLKVYPFTSSIGTKYADPSTLGTALNCIKFVPATNAIIGGTGLTPKLSAWAWSSGFGAKYSNPIVEPSTTVDNIDVSPNGNYIAANQYNLNYVIAYNWSPSGFGTRFANSGSLGSLTAGGDVNFIATSNAVAVAHYRSPYISAFAFSSSGFGTKYSNPATLPSSGSTNSCFSVKFSPNGNYIAATTSSSPYVHVYDWSVSTGFGTKKSNPSLLPNASGVWTEWSSDSSSVFHMVASNTSPSPLIAYPFTAGYGAMYSAPASPPTWGGGTGHIAFGSQPAAYTLAASTASFTLTGSTAELTKSGTAYSLTAGVGAFTLAGNTATLTKTSNNNYSITASFGSFSFSAQSASLSANRFISASASSFALNGPAALLRASRLTSCTTASFLMAGYQVALTTASSRTISASTASFAWNGAESSILKGSRLASGVGSFTETASASGLICARIISSLSGTFTSSGQPSSLKFSRVFPTLSRQFDLSGISSDLLRTRAICATSSQTLIVGNVTYLIVVHPPLICLSGTFDLPVLASSMRYSNPKIREFPPRLEFQSSGSNVNLKPSKIIVGTMSFTVEQTACALKLHRV